MLNDAEIGPTNDVPLIAQKDVFWRFVIG
jgi:hypothetical protein